MQTHENSLFTPTEAAVLTRLSVKAVNNAIDKKTVPTVAGRRAGHATRLLDLQALMSLALERRLADRFVPELRRELFDALATAATGSPSKGASLPSTCASRGASWRPRCARCAAPAISLSSIPTSSGAILSSGARACPCT